MIDTFQMFIQKAYLSNRIEQALDMRVNYQDNVFILNNPIQLPGLQSMKVTNMENTCYEMLQIVINPTELIGNKQSVELFECTNTNIRRLRRELDELLASLHPSLGLTKGAWGINRIDYALQTKTPHVQLYTELESKGIIPYNYLPDDRSGSTYNKCKSKRINAYNKQEQLFTTASPDYIKSAAEGLYRFEVQCHNLSYLRNKYKVDNDLFCLFREDIALQELKSAHRKHIVPGDYMRYEDVIEQINNLYGKQKKVKQRMLALVEFIREKGSIQNALGFIRQQQEPLPPFLNELAMKDRDEVVKKVVGWLKRDFFKLSINPICLPENDDTSILLNTYRLLFEQK